MEQLLKLATGTVTTTSVAVITVPAGEIWEVRYCYIQQPTTAAAKIFAMGRNTLTTVTDSDCFLSRNLLSGIYSENIFCPFGMVPADVLHLLVSVGTTELTYDLEGYKRKIA